MKLLLLAALAAYALAGATPAPVVDTAKSTDKKDEYVVKARAELDELSAKIDELEARSRKAGADAKKDLDKKLAELKPRREKARKDLARLKRASGKAWASIKAGLQKGIDDLKKELDEAETTK